MAYNGILLAWIENRSMEQAIIAYRGKMTTHEMLRCLEISNNMSIPIDDVLIKMANFKETSDHLLYKQEFLFI